MVCSARELGPRSRWFCFVFLFFFFLHKAVSCISMNQHVKLFIILFLFRTLVCGLCGELPKLAGFLVRYDGAVRWQMGQLRCHKEAFILQWVSEWAHYPGSLLYPASARSSTSDNRICHRCCEERPRKCRGVLPTGTAWQGCRIALWQRVVVQYRKPPSPSGSQSRTRWPQAQCPPRQLTLLRRILQRVQQRPVVRSPWAGRLFVRHWPRGAMPADFLSRYPRGWLVLKNALPWARGNSCV